MNIDYYFTYLVLPQQDDAFGYDEFDVPVLHYESRAKATGYWMLFDPFPQLSVHEIHWEAFHYGFNQNLTYTLTTPKYCVKSSQCQNLGLSGRYVCNTVRFLN